MGVQVPSRVRRPDELGWLSNCLVNNRSSVRIRHRALCGHRLVVVRRVELGGNAAIAHLAEHAPGTGESQVRALVAARGTHSVPAWRVAGAAERARLESDAEVLVGLTWVQIPGSPLTLPHGEGDCAWAAGGHCGGVGRPALGDVAQLVARSPCTRQAGGSRPLISTGVQVRVLGWWVHIRRDATGCWAARAGPWRSW